MGKKADIKNKRFGRLIAVYPTEKRIHRNVVWFCRCDCGGSTEQKANTLLNRLVKSCGCYQRDVASKRMQGPGNPMWKGDNVGLISLHGWVRRRKPKPKLCEVCKKRKPQDLANISQQYHRNINDFQWVCRKCHMDGDGRNKQRGKDGRFIRIK